MGVLLWLKNTDLCSIIFSVTHILDFIKKLRVMKLIRSPQSSCNASRSPVPQFRTSTQIPVLRQANFVEKENADVVYAIVKVDSKEMKTSR
jgi:hypothetical protein